MITFDVKLENTTPQIHVKVPLDEYLLDDEQVATAKQTIQGIINLCAHGTGTLLFVNGEDAHIGGLRDIVERYRSLYLLKLLEDIFQRVKPLNDSFITEIAEKVEPLIERSKDSLKKTRYSY